MSKRKNRERRIFAAQVSGAEKSKQPEEKKSDSTRSTSDKAEPVRPVITEPVPGAPYKINIVQPDKANPGLEMTWCLSPAFLHELADRFIFNPFLFIVVVKIESYGYMKEIERRLVPLKQGGTRLEFYDSGSFKIFTMVVRADKWHDATSQFSAYEYLKPITEMAIPIFYRGQLNISEIKKGNIHGMQESVATSVVQGYNEYPVSIDSEFFAPEPSKWLAWWVNLWFENKLKNQCHFRKRMIPALSIQPPMVLLWILLRGICGAIFALVLALIGWKSISLKPIFRPFARDLKDINSNWSEQSLGNAEGYWTIGRGTGDQFRKYPVFLRILLTPLQWVCTGLILYFLVYRFPEAGIDVAIGFGLLVLAIFLAISAVVIAMYIRDKCSDSSDEREKRKEAREAAIQQMKEQRSREMIKRKFVELTCGAGGPSDGHLRSIPARHQTFYTRFEALKGRVCKPYAKGYSN